MPIKYVAYTEYLCDRCGTIVYDVVPSLEGMRWYVWECTGRGDGKKVVVLCAPCDDAFSHFISKFPKN